MIGEKTIIRRQLRRLIRLTKFLVAIFVAMLRGRFWDTVRLKRQSSDRTQLLNADLNVLKQKERKSVSASVIS